MHVKNFGRSFETVFTKAAAKENAENPALVQPARQDWPNFLA
jgi:hypothetical protein